MADYINPAKEQTIYKLLREVGSCCPNNIAVSELKDDTVNTYALGDLFEDAVAIGTVFTSMGMKGKIVALAGKNSYNWIITFFGAVMAGACVLTIDPSLNAHTVCSQLKRAKADVAVIDYDIHNKLNDYDNSFTGQIVVMDDYETYAYPNTVGKFIKLGENLRENGYEEFSKVQRQPSDLTHIAFDSAVYGMEKAVVLPSRAVCARVRECARALTGSRYVLITENFSSMRSLYMGMLATVLSGRCACIYDGDISVYEAAHAMGADNVVLSPFDASEFYHSIWAVAKSKRLFKKYTSKIKSAIFFGKLLMNTRNNVYKFLNRNNIYCIKNMLVFGDNTDAETAYGLYMSGVNLKTFYDVPECGLVSLQKKAQKTADNFGIVLPDIYIKLDNLGRILVKSESAMMGYLGEGQYPDSWIPTGDIGDFDGKGRLVTEKNPDVCVTEKGKRIFTERIRKMAQKLLPYAETVSVNVEDEKIILTVSFEHDFMALSGSVGVRNIVKASVNEINAKLCEYERITDIVIEGGI